MKRVNEKIKQIESFLDELKDIIPDKFKEYRSSNLVKAGCERYFEKIIEGVTDISFMVIAIKKLKIPEDDIASFRILLEHKIITERLYKKLKEGKGMRNILAHQYGDIDDEIIYESITQQLDKDVRDFIDSIKKYLL